MAEEGGAVGAMPDLNKTMEALRATRDLDTCLQGLKHLRSALRGEDRLAFLESFVHKSPDMAELHAIWDSQLAMKDDRVAATLLLVLIDILTLPPASTAASSAAGRAADALAASIVAKRIKALYFLLGSDHKGRVNASLALMTALVRRGCARDLVRGFDFDVPAFGRAARAPRQGKGQEEGGFPPVDMHALWTCDTISKRVTRSLFVDFGLALLGACDAALLSMILPIRPLFGGLLLHLHQQPPHIGTLILQAVKDKVLNAGNTVPPRLKAEPFGDAVLTQLANLAALDGGEPGTEELTEEAGSVLHILGTDPSVGLCPARGSESEAGGGPNDSQAHSGRRRLMRLLFSLKPTKSPRHFQLLTAVTQGSPEVAAAFIAGTNLNLEPKLDTQWLAGMALAAQVTEHAMRVTLPFLAIAQREGGPPAMDSGVVRGLLRRMLPACISKMHLSRGLQHISALVRYVTLCTLRRLLAGVSAALIDLSAAAALASSTKTTPKIKAMGTGKVGMFANSMIAEQAAAAGMGELLDNPVEVDRSAAGASESPGVAWEAFARNLRNAVRARVPDVKALQSLLTALETEMAAPATDMDADEQVSKEVAALRHELGEPVRGALSGAQLSLAALLGVLAAYQRCIPEAAADAHFDPARLLAKDIASWPPLLQHNLLELLTAASGSSGTHYSSSLYSPASLQALLKLTGPAAVPGNARLAQQLLKEALLAAVGFEEDTDEVLVWLHMLPSRHSDAEEDRSSQAVAAFLVEAVTSVARRPHEMYELAVEHCAGPELSSMPALRMQFSLLAVAALTQALRVVRSEKMPSASRAAVASYVGSVLAALIRIQRDPSPLCYLISGLAFHAAYLMADNANAQTVSAEPKGTKRWWDGSIYERESSLKLRLPKEGSTLASLEAFARSAIMQRGRSDGVPALKKRKLSATEGRTAVEDVDLVIYAEYGVDDDEEVEASAVLRQIRGPHELQAFLLTQSARYIQAHLLQLASVCQGTLKGDFRPLVTAVRAHPIHICASYEMRMAAAAGTGAGAVAENRHHRALLDACPFPILAHAACCTPGLMDPATDIGHLLLQRLNHVPSEGQAIVLRGLLFWAVQLEADAQILFACDLAHISLKASCTSPEGLPSQEAVEGFFHFIASQQHSNAWTRGAASILEWLLPRTRAVQQSCSDDQLAGRARVFYEAAEPFLQTLGAACLNSLSSILGDLSGDPPQAAIACGKLASYLPLPLLQQLLESLKIAYCGSLPVEQPGDSFASVSRPWADILAQLTQAGIERREGGGQLVCALAAMVMSGRAEVAGLLHAIEGACDLILQLGQDALKLLEWCMRQHSTTAAQLAARLITSIPVCALRFSALLPSVLHNAGTVSAIYRREAIAVLLPAAQVYLQQLPLSRNGGAVRPEQTSASVHDAVATALRDPLLAYLSRKGKSGEAELSASAVVSLADNAADVLMLCLRHHPLAPDQAQKFFQRITPPVGWLSSPAKAAAVQGARSRASVAAHLLQAGKDSVIWAGSSEAGDEVGSKEDAYDKALVSYAIACLATLEVVLKLPAGSSSQAGTDLQRQLLHDLDTFIGDAIAESHAAKQAPELSASLASAVQRFAAIVLQHQFHEAGIVRSLRRFLAALLPTDEADDDSAGDNAPGSTAKSASIAAMAHAVTGLLLGNSRFKAVVGTTGGSALPAGISNLITPMSSLLTLVDAAAGPLEERTDQMLKREILDLLEILLDLHAQHSDSAQGDASVTMQLQRLLPLLLVSYGATLSATDRAALRVLLLLDDMTERAGVTGRGQEQPVIDSGSFLAQAGFLWGEAAMKAKLEGAPLLPSQPAPSDLLANRHQLLASLDWIDQRCCALTVCHFPESRTLTADEAEEAEGAGPPDTLAGDMLDGSETPYGHELPASGYDPAFLLRFCVQALRVGSVRLESFAAKGLLSLCLRCLACEDAGLRGLAYEIVALYSAQLDAASFRDKQQLSALLKALQLTVSAPFQRLPALIAVFLAEAATVLQHPQSTLYSQVNKLLTRRSRLKLEEVPLMAQLWMSGVEDTQAEERAWLLRLLTAGLQGPLDGDIFRKRFVGELLMSLHGSPLSDTQLNSLALLALCKLPNAPAYAGDLVLRAGLIPWLSIVANTALHSYETDPDISRSLKHRRTAITAAQLLLRLLHVRNWAKQGALLGPLADFGLAALSICQSLAGHGTSTDAPRKMLPADIWSTMLSFVAEVLRLCSRPAHQPGSLARLRNGVLSLSDISCLVRPVKALAQAGEKNAERLRQQLLNTLLLVEVFPASSADQQSFTPVCEWAISTAALLPASRPTQPSAAAATLAWISSAILRGAVLRPPTPKDRVALTRQVLALQAATRISERHAYARSVAVVVLHLLQPFIAAEFGIGERLLCGWLAGAWGPSGEICEPRPAASGISDGHPAEITGGLADEEHAEEAGSEDRTAEDIVSTEGASDEIGGDQSTGDGGASAVKTYEAVGRVTTMAQAWRYLLGNTLLRLLDELGLPRFGGRGSGWPVHSIPGLRATLLPSKLPPDKQDAVDGGKAAGDAQGRVAELVLLMLRELLAGLWPDLTILTMRDWAAGSEDVRGRGETELRCAELAGIGFCV